MGAWPTGHASRRKGPSTKEARTASCLILMRQCVQSPENGADPLQHEWGGLELTSCSRWSLTWAKPTGKRPTGCAMPGGRHGLKEVCGRGGLACGCTEALFPSQLTLLNLPLQSFPNTTELVVRNAALAPLQMLQLGGLAQLRTLHVENCCLEHGGSVLALAALTQVREMTAEPASCLPAMANTARGLTDRCTCGYLHLLPAAGGAEAAGRAGHDARRAGRHAVHADPAAAAVGGDRPRGARSLPQALGPPGLGPGPLHLHQPGAAAESPVVAPPPAPRPAGPPDTGNLQRHKRRRGGAGGAHRPHPAPPPRRAADHGLGPGLAGGAHSARGARPLLQPGKGLRGRRPPAVWLPRLCFSIR